MTVAVGKAESELSKLRREAALAADPENLFPDIRAAVATLVIWSHESAAAEAAGVVGSLVAGRHPCRIVLAVPGDGPVDADVSAQCSLSKGGAYQVCTEQVTVRGGRPSNAASAVEQLLLGNVPVVVWSVDGLVPADAARLYQVADRLIYDSDDGIPAGDIARLQAETAARRTWTADLAWTRLTLWRSLMAQFFDVPSAATLLHQLQAVRVTWPREALAPWFLAGWALDRLRRRPPDVAVEVGEGPASFVLDCGPETFHVAEHTGGLSAWRGSEEAVVRHVPCIAGSPPVVLACELADELAQVRPDPAFAAALPVALELMAPGGS